MTNKEKMKFKIDSLDNESMAACFPVGSELIFDDEGIHQKAKFGQKNIEATLANQYSEDSNGVITAVIKPVNPEDPEDPSNRKEINFEATITGEKDKKRSIQFRCFK